MISKSIIKWVCGGVLIAIALIWLATQQVQINKYQTEIAELEEQEVNSKERISELETTALMYETDEYIEREARKRGYVRSDEIIFKEAD